MKLAQLISFISLSVLFITLSSCNTLPANTITPVPSYVDTNTPKPTSPPNDNQSAEVVSILGPFRLNGYPPVQIEYARGPYLEMALKNTGIKPLISLTASLKLNKSFEFKFWVLPNIRLPAGRTIRSGSLLNDGEFNHGVFYPLTITGITEDWGRMSIVDTKPLYAAVNS